MNDSENNNLTLPKIAELVREWFPFLENRSFPAMGDSVTKDNMPTLPFAVVLPMTMNVEKQPLRSNTRTAFSEDFQIKFWLPPNRVKRENKTETPFWSFYDYRNNFVLPLIGNCQKLRDTYDTLIEFRGAEVSATDSAIIIATKFRQHYNFSFDEKQEAPNRGFIIKTSIYQI